MPPFLVDSSYTKKMKPYSFICARAFGEKIHLPAFVAGGKRPSPIVAYGIPFSVSSTVWVLT